MNQPGVGGAGHQTRVGSSRKAKLSHVSALLGVKRPAVTFNQKSPGRVVFKVCFPSLLAMESLFPPKDIVPRILIERKLKAELLVNVAGEAPRGLPACLALCFPEAAARGLEVTAPGGWTGTHSQSVSSPVHPQMAANGLLLFCLLSLEKTGRMEEEQGHRGAGANSFDRHQERRLPLGKDEASCVHRCPVPSPEELPGHQLKVFPTKSSCTHPRGFPQLSPDLTVHRRRRKCVNRERSQGGSAFGNSPSGLPLLRGHSSCGHQDTRPFSSVW